MNTRSGQTFLTLLLACITLLTSGCSETTKEAPEQPDIVFPVSFPLINNSTLYSIEDNRFFGLSPEDEEASATSGLYEKLLLEIPSGMLLALDTDPSDKSSEDGVDSFTNTALPEYIVYVKNQTLRLYDLDTRYDHELYSFENDPFVKETSEETDESNKIKPRFICDIQKVVTWDDEARQAKKILFKDELAVYVKTGTLEGCAEPEEGFEYWQINVVESTKTFTIRRKTLKAHSHEHRHFHDHDDPDYEYADIHNHEHLLEEGELDENGEPFEANDHMHRHNHEHDFIYDFQHEHEHLSQDEIDAVHNDPINHEISFETNPVLVGRKSTFTSLDEALMYSGQPVIDLNARTFGYLGLNSKDNAFKFFTVNLDTLEKSLLWSAQHENLSDVRNTTWKNTNWRALVPKYNRFINYANIQDKILVTTDKNLFLFDMASLFDDDTIEERENSLANPLFSSSYTDPWIRNRTHYNASTHKMVITENQELWQIDFEQELLQAMLIKTFNETNLSSLEAKMMASEIMVIKRFNDNETPVTSITAIQESGIEVSTILNKTDDAVRVFNQGTNSFINIKSSDPDQQITAKLLFSDFGSPFSTLINTIWLQDTVDYRTFLEQEKVSLFASDSVSATPGTIERPEIYLLDVTATMGQGENLGHIPDTVSSVSGLALLSDEYTIMEYQNSDNESRFWYWLNIF